MAEATDSPLAARAPARMLAHFWMILGVIVVAFPVYYVAIASTHSTVTILRPPLPLLPGSEAVANYHDAFTGGISQIGGVGKRVPDNVSRNFPLLMSFPSSILLTLS